MYLVKVSGSAVGGRDILAAQAFQKKNSGSTFFHI